MKLKQKDKKKILRQIQNNKFQYLVILYVNLMIKIQNLNKLDKIIVMLEEELWTILICYNLLYLNNNQKNYSILDNQMKVVQNN